MLPENIQDKVNKKLVLFLTNSRLLSLRIKKMKGFEDIWEGRITKSYRFTFQIKGDVYILNTNKTIILRRSMIQKSFARK